MVLQMVSLSFFRKVFWHLPTNLLYRVARSLWGHSVTLNPEWAPFWAPSSVGMGPFGRFVIATRETNFEPLSWFGRPFRESKKKIKV